MMILTMITMILRMTLTIILMMRAMILMALMLFEDSDNDFFNYFEDKEGGDDDNPRS